MRILPKLFALVLLPGAMLASSGNAAEIVPPSLLYVQSSDRAIVRTGSSGLITLTLQRVRPRTVYFSDRPDRLSGQIRTTDFVSQWVVPGSNDSFAADPPNAAIVGTKAGTHEEQSMIVELRNPRLRKSTLTYTARRVDNDKISAGLQHYSTRHQARIPHNLVDVSVFIDDATPPVPTNPIGTHVLPFTWRNAGDTTYAICFNTSTPQMLNVDFVGSGDPNNDRWSESQNTGACSDTQTNTHITWYAFSRMYKPDNTLDPGLVTISGPVGASVKICTGCLPSGGHIGM